MVQLRFMEHFDRSFALASKNELEETKNHLEKGFIQLGESTGSNGMWSPEETIGGSEAPQDAAKSVEMQLRYVIDLVILESTPLIELEEYWKQRHRERFSLSNLIFASFMKEDLGGRLEEIRFEIRQVQRVLGKCEMHLAAVERARNLLDEKALTAAVIEAEHFVDHHILKTNTLELSSNANRIDRVLALEQGKLFVSPEKVRTLKESMPLWDRLGPTGKAVAWVGAGIGSYALILFAKQGASAGAIEDGEAQNSNQSQSFASSNLSVSHARERAQGTVQQLKENTGTWFGSATEWMKEHIYLPSKSMTEQMFLSPKSQVHARATEHELAVQDAKLSLQNMIREHGKRTNMDDNAVLSKANSLDMSFVSRDYERKIQQPIKNAVADNLVELMLIQGQFIKLQLLDAMLQIDRLLEENRFNSQLVILAPSLIVVGALYNAIKSVYYSVVDDSESKSATANNLRRVAANLSVTLNQLSEIPSSKVVFPEPSDRPFSEDRARVLEGKVTQLTYRMRSILVQTRNKEGIRLYDHLLEEILGRKNLTSESRARLSSQVLMLLCSE